MGFNRLIVAGLAAASLSFARPIGLQASSSASNSTTATAMDNKNQTSTTTLVMTYDPNDDWSNVALSILQGFNATTNNTYPSNLTGDEVMAELGTLIASDAADFDAALDSAFFAEFSTDSKSLEPSVSSSSSNTTTTTRTNIKKKNNNTDALHKRAVPCGLEGVVSTRCLFHFYHCKFMCIEMPKNFPYNSCSGYLINGQCPSGLAGSGFIRPAPPKQAYQEDSDSGSSSSSSSSKKKGGKKDGKKGAKKGGKQSDDGSETEEKLYIDDEEEEK